MSRLWDRLRSVAGKTRALFLFSCRALAGLLCLLAGLALCLTLVLIPVGVPLALFGVARMVTAAEGLGLSQPGAHWRTTVRGRVERQAD